MTSYVKLFHGMCLDIMPKLPDGSVDMIMCDLPYGTTDCSWDAVIPVADMWREYIRVCKPNAAIVLTSSQPFTTTLIASNLEMFRYCWVWDKVTRSTGFVNAAFMPLKRHEDVCVFVPSGKPTYNPQLTEGKPYKMTGDGKIARAPEIYRQNTMYNIDKVNDGTRLPVSILAIKPPNTGEGGLHPTQKPIELMEYFIKTYTNEGETVLDNTMGSGTTGVAAVRNKRQFIGIEQDPYYMAIVMDRINAEILNHGGQILVPPSFLGSF